LHDAALIVRCNEVIGPDDEIYHLGDFTASENAEHVRPMPLSSVVVPLV
jgi:calcineurin-like phosphoesterase family protein